MTRRRRYFASLVALVTLAFGQFMVSAHACERLASTAIAAGVADHPEGCPEAIRSPLCAEHCGYGAASIDTAKPVPAAGDVIGPFLGTIAAAGAVAVRSAMAFPVPPLAGPPPAIRFIALRI